MSVVARLPPLVQHCISRTSFDRFVHTIQNRMTLRTHNTKLGTLVPMMFAVQTRGAFYKGIVTQAHDQWLYTSEITILCYSWLKSSELCLRPS